jgi:hypothetical protein
MERADVLRKFKHRHEVTKEMPTCPVPMIGTGCTIFGHITLVPRVTNSGYR